jgi:hypothetical protein
MSFNVVASVTSIAGLVLGLGWMFGGALLLRRWGIEPHADGVLAGRRLGAAYLGIGVMLLLGRSAPPSSLRDAVAAGMFVALALMAAAGLVAFKMRRAGAGILASVALEIVLALGFAWALVSE